MKVIAITGGIGAGKSTVRRMFEELGARGIDADELSRKVVEPGTEGADLIREAFGTGFFDSTGQLDRKKMAAKVFAEPDARSAIEAILHPRIRDAENQAVEDFREKDPGAVIFVEIPLLAEGGRWKDYDGVVVVTAPVDVRISRLVAAGRYDREGALARMASQAGDEERESLADWKVDNGRDPEETARQVEKIYRELTANG